MKPSPLADALAQRAAKWLAHPIPAPDRPLAETSEGMRNEVIEAMEQHQCDHYTRRPGIAPLCNAVSEILSRRGVTVDADSGVVICGGLGEARYVALTALSENRKIVIAGHVDYAQDIGELLDCEIQEWNVDLDGNGTLLLIHTGSLSPNQWIDIASWCDQHDPIVIADESDDALDQPGIHPPFASQNEMAERTLSLGRFDSSGALDAWQVAWFAGPTSLVQQVRDLKQAITICSPAPAQYAALAHLNENPSDRRPPSKGKASLTIDPPSKEKPDAH